MFITKENFQLNKMWELDRREFVLKLQTAIIFDAMKIVTII
jgi:hypothetical protein